MGIPVTGDVEFIGGHLAGWIGEEIDPSRDIESGEWRDAFVDHSPASVSRVQALLGHGPSTDIRTGVFGRIELDRDDREWDEPMGRSP